MKVEYHKNFIKHYNSRIQKDPKLVQKFQKRLVLFLSEQNHPVLKDHALVGKQEGIRAFSLTGDYRVVYYAKETGIIVLIDIGTHNQVY